MGKRHDSKGSITGEQGGRRRKERKHVNVKMPGEDGLRHLTSYIAEPFQKGQPASSHEYGTLPSCPPVYFMTTPFLSPTGRPSLPMRCTRRTVQRRLQLGPGNHITRGCANVKELPHFASVRQAVVHHTVRKDNLSGGPSHSRFRSQFESEHSGQC